MLKGRLASISKKFSLWFKDITELLTRSCQLMVMGTLLMQGQPWWELILAEKLQAI